MINQISQRLPGLSLAMLSPSWLIDKLLDRIEKLGAELVPVQAGRSPREPATIDASLEPKG